MITHYDMAGCELIAEPETSADADPVSLSLPALEPRLQTVAEARQAEQRKQHTLPPDLGEVEAGSFIARQG